jgi:hypothetical protein
LAAHLPVAVAWENRQRFGILSDVGRNFVPLCGFYYKEEFLNIPHQVATRHYIELLIL